MQEIKEEHKDVRENEQAIVVSLMKEREERHRSRSLIWNLSPEVKEYHHGIAKGSEQQGNNAALLEMLNKMEN